MDALHESLQKLSEFPQFILVQGKVPVGLDYKPIDPHRPENWMAADDAISRANLLGLGVGFVFTANDPFWFLDIDHCYRAAMPISRIAQQLLDVFNGAAVEVSTSGDGLHIFGCAHNVPDHGKKNRDYGIEFYTEGRFALLTGNGAAGNIWTEWGPQVRWLVDTYFPSKLSGDSVDWRSEPVPDWSGPEDDEVLLGKMLGSRGSAASVMGGRASVRDLFNANDDVLGQSYPPQNDSDPYDRSSADAALANHLAFWTGKDHERIRRLMYRSALVRDKWETHPSYMERTIRGAVEGCQNVYQGGGGGGGAPPLAQSSQPGTTTTTSIDPIYTTGVQMMSVNQQVEYFKDCVYLKRNHGVLTPNGAILKPEQFKAAYAGYTFSLDMMNDKTTRSAWEAFIDNQGVRFSKVDGVCFRPHLEPKFIVHEEGFDLVNSYVPVQMPRVKGDVSLFLDHMAKLFPVQSDRDVILAYMAAVVQRQGVKFQWCPIIQGGEGNGKTIISRVIEKAVGSRYTHYPNASDLAGNGLKFNGWIECKVYIGIEEIYVSDRREITEPLKVFVTNERMEIQHKGMAQYTGDNLANIIMFSNHKDCMRMTYDQRRYFLVFTGQQNERDLQRYNMTDAYFKKLYGWLNQEEGYAKVADFLWTYPIPESINFTGRAPESSSIHEAVANSLGLVEQCILEAVEEERPGFRSGYISSKCLSDLLREINYDTRISPQKRSDILESLGYVRHPWLREGRVNNTITAEGSKSRLYFKGDLPAQVAPAAWVKDDYEEKQGYTTGPNTGALRVV